MTGELPLSSLLSQLLVAYTIECDTEFERREPHRTAVQGRRAGNGPWLTSLVMWGNFLRYLPAEGATRAELQPLSSMVNLAGLHRWGYLIVEPAADGRRAHDHVRLRPAGSRARQAWPQVVEAVQARWLTRMGADLIEELQAGLDDLSDPGRTGRVWPDHLPVVGYGDGMRAHLPSEPDYLRAIGGAEPATDLAAALGRVVLAFTVGYELRTRLSLTMLADVMRPIGPDGARVRDLSAAGGVSREGVSAALTFLQRHRLAVVASDPDFPRTRRVELTERGRWALKAHPERLRAVEQDWRDRFGDRPVQRILDTAKQIHARTNSDGRPLLAAGLHPYPDSWRAKPPYLRQTRAVLADPGGALPHHPMVLHRGGYPDGS